MDFIHKIERFESSVAAVHTCFSVGITSTNKIRDRGRHVRTTNQIIARHKTNKQTSEWREESLLDHCKFAIGKLWLPLYCILGFILHLYFSNYFPFKVNFFYFWVEIHPFLSIYFLIK